MPKSQIEQWFVDYSHDIYHFLTYYTGKTDVEDIVQEVFIKALHHLHQYKNTSSPKTWLISIARNLAIDIYRRQQIAQLLPERLVHFISPNVRTPEQELELQEEFEELYKAINRLKRSYREVVLLRGIQELSVNETAEILGWSANRVNVTYHRALKELKKSDLLHEREGVLGNVLD